MKGFTFFQQVAVESSIIIVNHLRDNRQFRRFRLQNHQSSLALSASPSTHLRHHHKGMFVGPEVRIIEHRVGIENTHNAHLVKIQSLGNHLRTDKQIGLSRRKILYQAFIGIAGAGRIKIHTGNTRLREDFSQLIFHLLCSDTTPRQFGTSTVRTFRRNRIRVATIMAGKQIDILMQCERYITVFAFRNPSTDLTLNHRRKTAPILKENSLFATLQGLSYGSQELWRICPLHDLAMAQILHIHHLYFRQLDVFISRFHLHQTILSLLGIVITFHRRSSRTQEHFGFGIHTCQNDGCAAGMIARSRILLLETGFMLLIHYHKSEFLKRQEDCTSGS